MSPHVIILSPSQIAREIMIYINTSDVTDISTMYTDLIGV